MYRVARLTLLPARRVEGAAIAASREDMRDMAVAVAGWVAVTGLMGGRDLEAAVAVETVF